jgi:lipoyl(octanoyl) transferase
VATGWCTWLGRIGYREARELQERAHRARVGGAIPDLLLLLEHDPVITLGAAHDPNSLLWSEEQYAARGIEVVETDRGGDATYHGPGQLVGYPIFDLQPRGRDVHKYLRDLEEALIRCMASLGLAGIRRPAHTGVWVGDEKVCAIGIKVARWVTLHGFALNVSDDLSPFAGIVPCGLAGLGVNSIAALTGTDPGMTSVRQQAVRAFEAVFDLRFQAVGAGRLEEAAA